jgi:HAMP domain-containing protein
MRVPACLARPAAKADHPAAPDPHLRRPVPCLGACLLAFTYLVVAHLIGSYSFSFQARSNGINVGVHFLQVLQTSEQQQADAEKRQLLVVSGITLAIMAAASAGLGWVMAGRVLRPLRTITATARHISALDLDRRLALHGPGDELSRNG